MDPVFIFFMVGIAVALVMALVPARKQGSLKRFFIALFLSFFGILLPLVFFFLSAFLTPDAKDNCHYGWIDCFHTGKLALTPFVLWASAALYAVEIYQVQNRTRPWIVLGFFIGALVSGVCVAFGIACCMDAYVALIVPVYVAIWYSVRTVQLVRASNIGVTSLVMTVASSLPFWAASAVWSYYKYFSLPDHIDDCFIVTAASRGHRKFVGPFLEVPHRGKPRLANQQLATFWQFEYFWRNHAPSSHAAFRGVYNRVGPVIARCVITPWVADVVYIALKPAELLARCLINVVALAITVAPLNAARTAQRAIPTILEHRKFKSI